MRCGSLHAQYGGHPEIQERWRALIHRLGGSETEVGRSVEGRSLWRFDLGPADAPVVMLTALIHGVEVIGSLALFEALRGLRRDEGLLASSRLVVMPVVNPDALAANMERLARGRIAYQRRNARGVDLNRNFPPIGGKGSWHPFAGSAWRWSPYHRGPHPLSEPESAAVAEVATQVRPQLSLGFHSFGNLLLYPWAHTRARNPHEPAYRRLGTAFVGALGRIPYAVRQAIDLYPTRGDLDDWLDATFGTLALTVEVGGLDRRLWHPLAFANPFCWMNPTRVEPTVTNVAPAVINVMQTALAA